ncbi:MAG: ecotin family protein [Flavobacteriaceae bacterium]|nr:ecotin family protein [Flavobacteriaceae bacterium]
MRSFFYLVLFFGLQQCNSNKLAESKSAPAAEGSELDFILSQFPEAEPGQKRVFILMEPKSNEENYQVQIGIGKRQKVDPCNTHFLDVAMEKKEKQGFTYFQFGKATIQSTLMHCTAASVERLVNSAAVFEPYNSQIPIVAYIPNDCDLYYHVWTPKNIQKADKGLDKTDLSMFPNTESNMRRWVIDKHIEYIDPSETGIVDDKRFAFWLSKKAALDNCNTHILGCTYKKKLVDGWQFEYYRAYTNGIMSTRMGCLDSEIKEQEVLSIPQFASYNKRVPLVIYTRSDVELYYAIWHKQAQQFIAKVY